MGVVEGKADYVRISREKGLTYRWSRNPLPRWLQRQTRERIHLGTRIGGGDGRIGSRMGTGVLRAPI